MPDSLRQAPTRQSLKQNTQRARNNAGGAQQCVAPDPSMIASRRVFEKEQVMSDTDDRDEMQTKASFEPGDRVRVSTRFPVGHCAVPHYVRVEAVIAPAAPINGQEEPEENTRPKLCHYHIAIPLAELWPEYAGVAVVGLHAEVIETWLERA
jgi:nitrile hydratase subunit beta